MSTSHAATTRGWSFTGPRTDAPDRIFRNSPGSTQRRRPRGCLVRSDYRRGDSGSRSRGPADLSSNPGYEAPPRVASTISRRPDGCSAPDRVGPQAIGFVTTSQLCGSLTALPIESTASGRVDGVGLELDPELVFSASSDADGDGMVTQLLSRSSRRPRSWFLRRTGSQCPGGAGRAGIVAPSDISVLGFARDHAMSERFGLSTMVQPRKRARSMAATMALTACGRPPRCARG